VPSTVCWRRSSRLETFVGAGRNAYPPFAGVGRVPWNASTMWTYVAVAVGVLVVVNILIVVLVALASRSRRDHVDG